MSYFDENKETFLYTDASPYGVPAVLLQKSANKESKVISYSSRALTETEQIYSQMERECLSTVSMEVATQSCVQLSKSGGCQRGSKGPPRGR